MMNARMENLENFKRIFCDIKNVFINKETNTRKQWLQDARKFCYQILLEMVSEFKQVKDTIKAYFC